MRELLGSGAALLSCVLWSFSILMIQPLLARHGAIGCNLFKASLAALLFSLTTLGLLATGLAGLPSLTDTGMLILSGAVGMALGDFLFFEAMTRVGPRQATLIHSTFPVFLLFFSIWNPDEVLHAIEILGVILVIIGVMEVTRRQSRSHPGVARETWKGTVLAFGSSFSQALGIILAKEAMVASQPIVASNIRLFGGVLGMLLGVLLFGRGRRAFGIFRDVDLLRLGFLPVFLGTYLGIGTMMFAISYSKTAVAGALLSLTPVFVVPIMAWRERSRFEWAIFAGTLVAVIGAILVSYPRG